MPLDALRTAASFAATASCDNSMDGGLQMGCNLARRLVVLLMVSVAHGCTPLPEPQRTVRQYVRAVERGDCAAAWAMLSTANQHAIDVVWQHRRTSDDIQRKMDLFCYGNRFHGWKLDSLRVVAATPGRATLAVDRAEASGFRIPGFLPSTTSYRAETIFAVREGGRWRIEHPPMARYIEIQERQRALARAGG